MSLYNYLVKSRVVLEEIRMEFDQNPEQVEELHNFLCGLGLLKHLRFVRENQKDILKYISQSRSQREKKKWKDRMHGLHLRFAALQISYSTDKLLTDADGIAEILDSGSYRQFHSEVAIGVMNLSLLPPLMTFPFDGYQNPFAKK